MTNGYPEHAIKARRKYSKSQKYDFDLLDSDKDWAEN